MARWGMPTPPKFLEGKKSDPGVTNIRNAKSPHWRRWLGVESRCLVPFTSFAEPDNGTFGGRASVWFAFGDSRPLACFAGIWTRWTSVRKVREGETTNDIFAFLTINPNADVGAIHPKAMPVILRTEEERDAWMTAPAPEALKLQRPLPDGALHIVAQGAKEDSGQWPRCLPASFSDVRITSVAMANATLSKNRRTDGLRASFGSDTQSGTQMISSGVVAKISRILQQRES